MDFEVSWLAHLECIHLNSQYAWIWHRVVWEIRTYEYKRLGGTQYYLVYLFQLLYMFRANTCPSPAEFSVSMRHWYFSLSHESHPDQQTRQPPTQSEKYQCRTDTVSSPDDGHTVARNM